MIYSELVEYFSISLADKYREVIEPPYIDVLNDTISGKSDKDSCEYFVSECKNNSHIGYSKAELESIQNTNDFTDLNKKLRLKILAGIVENTLISFNDEDFLTIGKILYPDKFSAITVIAHEKKSRERDTYFECQVCNYKTLIVDDYNDFCPICYWDFQFCDDNGRYEYNLDSNGQKMTLQQGREYFKKHGVSKPSKLLDQTLFKRWLHDLAITKSECTNFFEYRIYTLKNCTTQ